MNKHGEILSNMCLLMLSGEVICETFDISNVLIRAVAVAAGIAYASYQGALNRRDYEQKCKDIKARKEAERQAKFMADLEAYQDEMAVRKARRELKMPTAITAGTHDRCQQHSGHEQLLTVILYHAERNMSND